MLKLKNICKNYNIDRQNKKVLDNITLDFKSKELVFILGPSGSGKSTLLNIIGGNLKCDSGKIYFDNLCITNLKSKELDNYRKYIVSTIFQDYNLIDSLTVFDNIMLGCHKKTNKETISLLLKQLNIYDKSNSLVCKLSGGEKQRVAIARTLINDPQVILADEPTGALDSKTSIEVMELFKKIAQNKLVIIVTHNNLLANKYGNRIITIKDGKCKYQKVMDENKREIALNGKYNHLKDIFKLAIKAIKSRMVRTIFTILAIGIGILSMLLVTNIYSNFNNELNNFEESIVTIFPITIKNGEYELSNNDTHINKIDNKYIDYLNSIAEIKYLTYEYDILLPIITDKYKLFSINYLEVIPDNHNYDIVYGRQTKDEYEVLLKLNSNSDLDEYILDALNIDKNTSYNDIIGRKLKIALNNDYFIKNDNYYLPNDNLKTLYEKSHLELTIVGIIKEKTIINPKSTLIYNGNLFKKVLDENQESNIVKDLLNDEYHILSYTSDKEDLLSYLGYQTLPIVINIYAADMKDKQKIIDALDKYNSNNDKLIYTDNMSSSINIVRKFILVISLVLIIFSLLAIITSSIMMGVLTGINVLEHKREIGILKSLGYSKSNIQTLFNLENMLIGTLAYLASLIVLLIILKPSNKLIENYIGINNLLNLNYHYMIIIFIINLIIIKIATAVPIMRASKLDAVTCIYGK